jgi:3-methyl-2-oxobutanoate hydroxymethyltransferase
MPTKKITINTIKKMKNNTPITMITAYDALFAKLFDESADILLVGDSLNMSFMGKEDTLSATLDQMIYHTQAVCNGRTNALVVCDMPFGTYTSEEQAVANAVRVYQESGADAVKIEGGQERAKIVKALTQNSIAVMGHIGLMPQFVRSEGGYIVKGKDEVSIKKLLLDAKAIENAGAFAIVVEGVKAETAELLQQSVDVPLIGIGAGAGVDGQVLVWSDMLGFFEEFTPKFIRQYLDGASVIRDAVAQYHDNVVDKSFPSKDESY